GHRLVQRHPSRPEAPDPRLRAQRLLERLAEDDADVLHRVVVVDVCVAAGLDRQVEEAVLGQQIQHVIKERDRRADLPLAGPVQDQPDLDPAFGGVPLDRRPPRGLHRMRASTDCAPAWRTFSMYSKGLSTESERCSGAISFASVIASSSVGTTKASELRSMARAAILRRASVLSCSLTILTTSFASGADVVTSH